MCGPQLNDETAQRLTFTTPLAYEAFGRTAQLVDPDGEALLGRAPRESLPRTLAVFGCRPWSRSPGIALRAFHVVEAGLDLG